MLMIVVQLIVVLVIVGILISVARAVPGTFGPWVKWGILALAAVLVCFWLAGIAGLLGPVSWRYR